MSQATVRALRPCLRLSIEYRSHMRYRMRQKKRNAATTAHKSSPAGKRNQQPVLNMRRKAHENKVWVRTPSRTRVVLPCIPCAGAGAIVMPRRSGSSSKLAKTRPGRYHRHRHDAPRRTEVAAAPYTRTVEREIRRPWIQTITCSSFIQARQSMRLLAFRGPLSNTVLTRHDRSHTYL